MLKLAHASVKRLTRTQRLFSGTLPRCNASQKEDDFGHYDIISPEEPYVWGTDHITPRPVPPNIQRPPYAISSGAPFEGSSIGKLIAPEDRPALRKTAKLAKEVLAYAGSLVEVGVTTDAIDAAVHEYIVAQGAYPSPLLYKGYPKACCTSVNNIITHGIPDDRPLQDGDIINIDVTVYKDGFHGDTSQTFFVGDVDEQGRALVKITRDALDAGIRACSPGQPFKEIGKAIHELVKGSDFCVNTQFTGHGIGEHFHTPPWILHHLNDEPGIMKPGHCFTIEPIIIQGSEPTGVIFPDYWTVSTTNCARSAQAEHTVLITDTGLEILTG